ncbi:MAG: heparinase II/III domain-containing protein [Armatimonadota bacterium]
MVRAACIAALITAAAAGFARDTGDRSIPPFASPEYLEMFIATKTPYTHIVRCARRDCPGYANPGFLHWHRERPDHVQCRECETWYPNEEFPEDQYFEVDGERYYYHEDEDGRPLHFSGFVRYSRVMRALYDARYAARDYAQDGDVERGRQARDVLLAIAEAYPGYFYARTPTFNPGAPVFPDAPGNMGAGRLKQYFGDYGLPSFFCDIYDPLADSELLTDQQRLQVRALLEDSVGTCVFPYFRLYRATGNTAGQMLTDFMRAGTSFPDMQISDRVHEYHFGEERLLSGADLVHEAVEGSYGVRNLIANGFYSDGFWHEGSLSYQHMVLVGLLPALRLMEGYSDPPGYVPADPTWRPLDDFDPLAHQRLRRALHSLPLLAFPDGTALTIGDTHKGQEITERWQEALGEFAPEGGLSVPEQSAFEDGIGVAALRCGEGPDATAAFLTYGLRGGGHSHYDQLSLTFYALGHELATDIGYPDSTDPLRHRWWNRAAAHNTVVIDGRNQAQSMGRLELFAEGPRFRVAQASCGNAYPELADYRRTLVLVGDASDDSAARYLVDVFHVAGGETRDWAFHGQAEPDHSPAVFEVTGLDLTEHGAATLLEVTPGAEPETMGYDEVTELRHGTVAGPWEARWRMPDADDLTLRLLAMGDPPGAEVFVGSAPGHRRPPKQRVDIGRRMTWLCRRRPDGPDPTAFTSVIEAQAPGGPAPVAARTLECSAPGSSGATALEVTHASGSDVFIIAREAGEISVAEIGLTMDGRIGLVSFDRAGEPTDAMLLDGRSLAVGDLALEAEQGSLVGEVTGLPEGVSDAPLVIEVDMELAEGDGTRVVTIAHANGTASTYQVRRVEPLEGGGTRLTLDRSGLEGAGQVGRLSDDGLTLFANAGFKRMEPALSELFYDGAMVEVDGERVAVRSVSHHGRGEPFLHEVSLRSPLEEGEALVGRPLTVSRIAIGDMVRIPAIMRSSINQQ